MQTTQQTVFGQQTDIKLSESLLFTHHCKSDHEAEQLFYFGGTFKIFINDKQHDLKAAVCFAKPNEKIYLAWYDEKNHKYNHVNFIMDKNKVHRHNILAQIDLTQFIKEK